MTEQDIRALFPGTDRQVYFNSAAQGLLPLPAAKRMAEIADIQVQQGISGYPRYMAEIEGARSAMARLLCTEPGEVAFAAHTTAALANVAQGLEWQAGDEVVLADIEFPANVYPWAALRSRGVRLNFVTSDKGRIETQQYLDALGPRTRVLAVSHVQFSNGYRVDLQPLGKACAERGILFCVDAIQSLGVLPVDVHQLGIGVLAADARKWLCGPTGCGVFYVAKAWLPKIKPVAAGARSLKDNADMLQHIGLIDEGGQLDIEPVLREDASRYESGFPNITGLAGFRVALEVAEQIGREAILTKVTSLVERFVERLDAAGYAIYGPRHADERSGIVSFTVPGDPEKIFRQLHQEHYSIAVRSGRLRVAPHVFNTLDEVDRVMDRICQLAG
jgi:cysteine desulfurase/selenocysteine lyase